MTKLIKNFIFILEGLTFNKSFSMNISSISMEINRKSGINIWDI
tara:strand:- start:353 stop:484 length:132 start_codon:yes stop_codon:yes gene_type:complete